MSHFVSSPQHIVRSFRISPRARHRIRRIRLYVDLVGVTLVRLCLPLVHHSFYHALLSIYNVTAWTTIFTVNSTCLPEAGSTRIQQRKSWRYAWRFVPLFFITASVLAFEFHKPLFPSRLSLDKALLLIIQSYYDELLFRNTLQPNFRKLGLSSRLAIVIQSIFYAIAIYLEHASLPVVLSFWLLGLVNGWMVYRFRSMWVAFILGLAWNVLWLA